MYEEPGCAMASLVGVSIFGVRYGAEGDLRPAPVPIARVPKVGWGGLDDVEPKPSKASRFGAGPVR